MILRHLTAVLLTALFAGNILAEPPTDLFAKREFAKTQISAEYFAEGAGFGDFNRDKILDVVCGPYWYAGPDYKKRHRIYDGRPFPIDRGYTDNFFSYGYDVNQDGWTDIVTIGFPGRPAHWYENPQGKNGDWPKHLAFPGVGNESPTFADLTGDGQPEIVCSFQGKLGYATFESRTATKPWTFHAISQRGPWAPFTHGLGIGDVNGDGRQDLLTASGWFEQPASLKGDPLWKPHPFPFCTGGAQMFAYDVDGDGDNDIITSKRAHAYGLSWFENTRSDSGQITFHEHKIMGSKPEENRHRVAFSQLHAMALHDMDGDGLKDIISGKCYWAHNGHDPGAKDPAVLYYFKLVRNDKGAEFVPVQIDNDSGVGRQVSIADLNGDDRPDIVVANKKGVFVFHQVAAKANKSDAHATLYRDKWGVPHIWADDYASAGYAVGQAQCEDSLHNVIYNLHAGVGRLAELFGPSKLQVDIQARKLRHGAIAESAWPKLSRPVRELVKGYCAGVNDYLKAHPDELQAPVEKVTPVQVVAWHRSLMMRSALGISKADAEASKSDGYHPLYNPDRVGESDSAAPSAGKGAKKETGQHPGIAPGKSNSWALSGARTASGAPMLLIDPHWMAEGHLQLYEFWLHVRDQLYVGGFALTGTPLPGLGVTPYAAWTVTAGGADSSDAYALKINPDNPHQYRFDDGWEDMDIRKETIRIRHPDGHITEKQIEVLATKHGPVLETKGGTLFAAAMGGFDQANSLDQFFRMAAARTIKQFKAAIALDRLSYFNLMWATTEGDIGYVQTGQAPLRPEGFNWTKLIPGWTSASLYRGTIPFAKLPAVVNPLSGFLQNCNVAANVVAPGVPFTKDDFPPNVLYGHYGQYRARGARATRLLTEIDQATLDDGRRIAFDTYVPPADLWVPVILQAYTESRQVSDKLPQTDEARRLAEAARLIGAWNRYATRDSEGATVFRFWRLACHQMDSKVGRDRFMIANTPEIRRDALKALQQAADRLHQWYGRVAVPWGQIKRLRRGDREWPLSGDGLGKLGMDTLRATAADQFNDEHKLIPRGGQCVTSVVLLTNPPQIRTVVAYGQSNKPNSPHFSDQAPLYSEGRFREVPWTMEQLLRQVKSKKTMKVAR